jgi:hypothetical protein
VEDRQPPYGRFARRTPRFERVWCSAVSRKHGDLTASVCQASAWRSTLMLNRPAIGPADLADAQMLSARKPHVAEAMDKYHWLQ